MSNASINKSGSTAGADLLPFRLVKRSGLVLTYTANENERSVGVTREGSGVAIKSGEPCPYAYTGRTPLTVTRGAGIAIDDFLQPGADGIAALHDGTAGSIFAARALQPLAAGAGTGVIEVEILPGYAQVVDTP